MEVLIIILTLARIIIEIRAMFREKLGYILNIWKHKDMFRAILTMYLLVNFQIKKYHSTDTLITLAMVAVLAAWTGIIRWFNFFGPTAYYTRLIRETIDDIKWFLLIQIFFIFMFANCLY